MKQELATESRSAKTCTRGVLLVLMATWAMNTLLTCLEGMKPLMGCMNLGFSNKRALLLVELSHLTFLLTNEGLSYISIEIDSSLV